MQFNKVVLEKLNKIGRAAKKEIGNDLLLTFSKMG